jgi:hypothetical protein
MQETVLIVVGLDCLSWDDASKSISDAEQKRGVRRNKNGLAISHQTVAIE